MGQRVWIVQEIGWAYNDETYYRSGEDGYGMPVKAYATRDAAYKICKEMNDTKIEETKGSEMYIDWNNDEDNTVVTEFYEVIGVVLEGA